MLEHGQVLKVQIGPRKTPWLTLTMSEQQRNTAVEIGIKALFPKEAVVYELTRLGVEANQPEAKGSAVLWGIADAVKPSAAKVATVAGMLFTAIRKDA